MKLVKLSIENVRNLPDADMSFESATDSAPLDLALIYGPSASGKTTVLELVAASARVIESGGLIHDVPSFLRHDAADGTVATTWMLSEDEANLTASGERRYRATWAFGRGGESDVEVDDDLVNLLRHHGRGLEGMAYFSARRSLCALRFRPSPAALDTSALRVWPPRPNVHGCIPWLLAERAARQNDDISRLLSDSGVVTQSESADVLNGAKESIATMLPEVRLVSATCSADGANLSFLRRSGEPVELGELSTSERHAVLFATALDLLEVRDSVLIVDTPELGIAGDDHSGFLRRLVAVAGNNQIIVATGSTQIAESSQRSVVANLASAPVRRDA